MSDVLPIEIKLEATPLTLIPLPSSDLALSPMGIQGPKGEKGDRGEPGSAGSSYEATFTGAGLTVANLLVVTHGLNTYPSAVAVFRPDGKPIVPDDWHTVSLNAIAIDLTSFVPLAPGDWRFSIGG